MSFKVSFFFFSFVSILYIFYIVIKAALIESFSSESGAELKIGNDSHYR